MAEMDPKLRACYRDGAEIVQYLLAAKAMAATHEYATLKEHADKLTKIVTSSECIEEARRPKLVNAAHALSSFANQRDKEGVRQALKMVDDELALPVASFGSFGRIPDYFIELASKQHPELKG